MEHGLVAIVRKDTGQPAGTMTLAEVQSGTYASKVKPDPDQHPELKQDGQPRKAAAEVDPDAREAERRDRAHLRDQTAGLGTVTIGPAATTGTTTTRTAPASTPAVTSTTSLGG